MTSEQFIAIGSVVSMIASLIACTAWVVSKIVKLEGALTLLGVRIDKLELRHETVVHRSRV
jgi:hypothetical protein